MKDSVFNAISVSRLRMLSDGEGVTTLVAGFGCPLRCRYCLNPQCFLLDKPRKQYTVKQLIDEVSIDDLYFQATGGGVTFGGGEPLLYADFIHEFRKECPSAWKIGLESSLSVPTDALRTVISDIDFFIIDIKDMNPDIYRKYTGKSNDLLLNNLKYLISSADPEKIRIRIPLIKDFNTDADRQRSVKLLKEMGYVHFEMFEYDTHIPEMKRNSIGPK